MPRKGMRSLCFHAKTPSFRASAPTTPARILSSSESTMDKVIESAAPIITKWDQDSSGYARVTSLFYEDKAEAMRFLECVQGLQNAMHALVLDNSTSEKLVRGQNLMEIAMKRLQKELYQILSMNRAQLDPESVSTRSSRTSARSSISDYDEDYDDLREAGDSIIEVEEGATRAMTDLRSIAECMINSGYAKECISIYKIIRKSIVDEGVYRLGVEKLTQSQVNKMDAEVLDGKIKSWLDAVRTSIRTLFTGEKILCDHVFASSDSIRESCFTEISREGAMLVFVFPELVAKSKRSSPERMFRLLDMYTAISENWHEIELIFSFESVSVVRTQAVNSLIKLGESIRSLLSEFESTMLKDNTKSSVAGGGIHPLTIQAMNYLSLFADYSNIIGDIFMDPPVQAKSSLPKSYFDAAESDDSPAPAITLHIAWLILILLCKLDGKAKHYKDVSKSYLFLANNLRHLIKAVRVSNLKYLLGEEWIVKQESKMRQFVANYERIGWRKVYEALPEDRTAAISPAEAKEWFRRFNSSFEEVYRKQSENVVPDSDLQEEIKASIERKLVSAYGEYYDTHWLTVGGERNMNINSLIRYTPEDVRNHISELFYGQCGSEISSTSLSSLSTSSSSPYRRFSSFFHG